MAATVDRKKLLAPSRNLASGARPSDRLMPSAQMGLSSGEMLNSVSPLCDRWQSYCGSSCVTGLVSPALIRSSAYWSVAAATLLAASLVLLADSMARYARGEGSLWEVGLNLLGIIPGGRLLTGIGRLAGLTRIGSCRLAAARAGLTRTATALRAEPNWSPSGSTAPCVTCSPNELTCWCGST